MKNSSNNGMRWTARILGTLMVAFVLLFAIGTIIEGSRKQGPGLDVYTIIVFIVWGTGLAGLILAWWKEGLGGIISSVCFIVFNILAAVSPVPGSSYSFVLLLFMIPSILFLSCWWMERNNKIPST
jgi:uncharacterized membrane protein